MLDTQALESASDSALTFVYDGQVGALPHPRDLPVGTLVGMLMVGSMTLDLPPMSMYKRKALFEAWVAHHDLTTPQQTKRLVYNIDRYGDHLEWDLRTSAAGADLGELWRARRWRYLLNLIDHLPRTTYFTEAVSNDPEHAKMIAESLASQETSGESEAAHPPMRTWDQQSALLADLVDAVRENTRVTLMAAGDKNPPKVTPYSRPLTALDAARRRATEEKRLQAHESLADRLLARRKKAQPES